VLAELQPLLTYGRRASEGVPGIRDAPSPVDLLGDARRRDWD